MSWSTSSETVRVFGELVRLNASTSSACQLAAAQQRDVRLWRSLLDTGDEAFHFVNSLLDRMGHLGLASDLWSDWTPGAASTLGHVGSMDGDVLAALDRQLQRKLAAYDLAIHEPIDTETRSLLQRQRSATLAARQRISGHRGRALHAEAA